MASFPTCFPKASSQGLYHTADATLWFFHALDRYVKATSDRATLRDRAPDLAQTRSNITSAARASASASIPTTVCCAKGKKAINSPGWTRKSAIGS